MYRTPRIRVVVCDGNDYTRALLLERIAGIAGCMPETHASMASVNPHGFGASDSILVLNHQAHQPEPFALILEVKQYAPDTPVIIITSPAAPLRSMKAFQASSRSVDRIFSKPLDLDEFASDLAARVSQLDAQRTLNDDHLNLLRFLPTGALRRIFANPAAGNAELFEMTVMFTDIRDSSRLIMQQSARTYFAGLNAILAAQARHIRIHDGMVIKTTGDGLLAVFEGAARCHLALKCAAAIQKASLIGGIALGIGLSDGPVLTGILGSTEHLHFDVIGSHVHLAARLCGSALPGEILATAEMANRARIDVGLRTMQESIQVRGFDAPVPCIHIQPSVQEPS